MEFTTEFAGATFRGRVQDDGAMRLALQKAVSEDDVRAVIIALCRGRDLPRDATEVRSIDVRRDGSGWSIVAFVNRPSSAPEAAAQPDDRRELRRALRDAEAAAALLATELAKQERERADIERERARLASELSEAREALAKKES